MTQLRSQTASPRTTSAPLRPARTASSSWSKTSHSRSRPRNIVSPRSGMAVDHELLRSFGEQRADGSFSTTVVPVADLCVANLPGAIDEVHRRPVPVSVCVPSDEFVVQSDRILEPVLPHGTLDVLNGPLECELGSVHADDREFGLVLTVYPTQERERALAVHARERPELEQDGAVAKG